MRKGLLTVGIILLVFGAMIGIGFGKEGIIFLTQEPVDLFYDESVEIQKNTYIDSYLDMLFDVYAEREQTQKSGNTVTGHSYTDYYIVPVFRGDDVYFISMNERRYSDEGKRCNELLDESVAYFNYELDDYGEKGFWYTGVVTEIEDEAYDYLLDYFREMEYFDSEEEMKQYVLPLSIERRAVGTVLVMTAIAAVMLLAGMLLTVLGLIPQKKKIVLQNTAIKINGYQYPITQFGKVNTMIMKGKFVEAVQEIMQMTNCSHEYANVILENWCEYYK